MRMQVDFNSRAEEGFVVASTSRATGPVAVGDVVVAVDPDEPDMIFDAVVVAVREGVALLDVRWERASDAASALPPGVSLHSGNAAHGRVLEHERFLQTVQPAALQRALAGLNSAAT